MKKTGLKPLKGFPDVLKHLPCAEIQVEGAKAWILQSKTSQLVFFEFVAGTNVPEHKHNYDQWGIVVKGKMTLVVEGEPWMCGKGTEYLVPAGAKHSATFLSKTRVMDYFSEKNRYRPRAEEA